MSSPVDSVPGMAWQRVRIRHTMTAVVAVVLSCALHVIVIARFPAIPVGRPPNLEESTRIRPVVLGDVQQQMRSELVRPERFRPGDPELVRPESVPAEAFRELMDELVPDEPADPGVQLTGEDRAVAEPDRERVHTPWDARQDILQIRDRIVPDEQSVLPRRIVPDAQRIARAPDISMPAERPDEGWIVRGDMSPSTGEGDFGAVRSAAGRTGEDADSGEAEQESGARLERVDAIGADPEEVSEVAPIERLLALDLQVYRPPDDEGFVYFQIQIRRAGEEVLPVLAKDVLLVQDASASMTQRTVDRAKDGLMEALNILDTGDRFDVVAFREDIERAFGGWTEPVARSLAQARFFIQGMQAQGGTDVFTSLQSLARVETDPDRPVVIVFVSDAVPTTGVVDSSQILERFTAENAGRLSVFTVGGGPRINEYLLDFLSYNNRGDTRITQDREHIPRSIARLAREIRRPVLMDLRMYLAGASGVDVYPQMLTHLYLDRPLVVYGRRPVSAEPVVIQLIGSSQGDLKDMVFMLDFDEAEAGDAAIRTEWAWQKVYHLIGEHIRSDNDTVLTQIRDMANRYGLSVSYGSDLVPMHFQPRLRH